MFRVSNSATLLGPEDCGSVVVCGSHGGVYPAYLAAKAQVRAVLLSDAGKGLDDSGVAGLDLLEQLGIAACAVSIDTARIGDGRDMAARGRISIVNAHARAVGCEIGMACSNAAERLSAAQLSGCAPPLFAEGRTSLRVGRLCVIGVDSMSLVTEGDTGKMVVSGSHGGLIGQVRTAVKFDVLAAVCHDAGGGIDGAGYSRLPALDQLGVIGVTVDGKTARIGDASSIWATGVLSRCNDLAREAGINIGMSVPQMADRLEARQIALHENEAMAEKVMREGQS